MKYISTILFLIIFVNKSIGQTANKIVFKFLDHSKTKFNFNLENISNDNLVINQFYCEYKKQCFVSKSYTLLNDTLIINWNNSIGSINSPYRIKYQIDGKLINTSYTILPNEKICISVNLKQSDFNKIKNLKINFNQVDSLVVKLFEGH